MLRTITTATREGKLRSCVALCLLSQDTFPRIDLALCARPAVDGTHLKLLQRGATLTFHISVLG